MRRMRDRMRCATRLEIRDWGLKGFRQNSIQRKKQSECVTFMEEEDASAAKADVVVLDTVLKYQYWCLPPVGRNVPASTASMESTYTSSVGRGRDWRVEMEGPYLTPYQSWGKG